MSLGGKSGGIIQGNMGYNASGQPVQCGSTHNS